MNIIKESLAWAFIIALGVAVFHYHLSCRELKEMAIETELIRIELQDYLASIKGHKK